MNIQQYFLQAVGQHQAGHLVEAESLYRHILAFQPDHSEALHLLGVLLHQRGHHDAAVDLIQRSIALNPNHPAAYSNLGEVYRALGKAIEAKAAYRSALRLNPHYAEAYYNLGNVLITSAEVDEAIACYRQAIHIRPDYLAAFNNLGNALKSISQTDEAILVYRHALQIAPNNAEMLYNLGIALEHKGSLDEAIAVFQAAIDVHPRFPEAIVHVGNVLKDQADLNGAISAYRRALSLSPEDPAIRSNLLHALLYTPEASKDLQSLETADWNSRCSAGMDQPLTPFANAPDPTRRIRIGYISPDFRDHVVGLNLLPLINGHDLHDFELFFYSDVLQKDDISEQFSRLAACWRETANLSHRDVAGLVHSDQIDVLVDLSQHSGGNRLPLFALQPAPVQVSFAGYPESSGVKAIGYRISDKWLEPGGTAAPDGVLVRTSGYEQVYLIDSFWCYNPSDKEVPVDGLPAQAAGRITFGSLNNFCKVNGPLLKLWARVLNAVKDSRLIIMSREGSHRQRTLQFLEREGVKASRVEFVSPCPRQEYLKLFRDLDIVLDTFPYSGHTTSLDALWMGVPVVSLCGERPVSRAGFSQLNNIGLPELVAFTEDQYVDIAVRLANDIPQLKELRATLRQRMEKSVLMDATHFARQIETCYRSMWRQWCTAR